MTDSRTAFGPIRLRPAIQHYGWGDPDFIPRALGVPADGRPWAEAWFGAHRAAPATALLEGGEERRLDTLLAEQPESILGRDVSHSFGRLPYLLKLLSAAKPLSIQVHPSRVQAEAGYAAEQEAGVPLDAPHRRYRDPQHKPELLVALTDFDALCGFRPPGEIAAALQGLPELAPLLPAYSEHDDAGETSANLRRLLEAYFALPAQTLQPALRAVVDRLGAQEARAGWGPADPSYWALRAHRELGPEDSVDRGLLFVFLLQLVRLQPGQGMFLPAGVPHAYLRGSGLELMASSDNVLRAGLTPKHVDPAELMRVVRFDAGPPPILEAVADAAGAQAVYPLPAIELDLRRFDLDPDRAVSRTARGPETLIALPEHGDTVVGLAHAGGHVELRPGQAVLVPDGVHYSLQADGVARVFAACVPAPDPATDYRGRNPTRLAFGTSGLRGLVTDITDLEAYVNTRGFLDDLQSRGEAVPGTTVAVAGDLRPSTDSPGRSILRAVVRAVLDSGMRPLDCGRIPTPALTYFGLRMGWPSIMVTGSHIPFDRNGIKFNKPSGEVLKTDEAGILAAVERVRRIEYGRDPLSSRFDDQGWLRPGQDATPPPSTDQARRLYIERYLDAFGAGALADLRVGLYEHSAVGRDVVAEILRGLGAQVHAVGRSERFVAIDTEAISSERLAELQQLADQIRDRDGPIDALVSTDGDSDRPLVLGVDENGRVRFLGGDVLGALVADQLGADAIAVPVSSNDLIERHFEPRGVAVVRTRIGSPWVIAAMSGLPGARRVGWEANGGFMTGSALTLDAGVLEPLPTRDAVLPIVAALHAARSTGRKLGELVGGLPPRFSRSGLLDQIAPSTSRAMLERFGPDDPRVRRVRFDDDRVRWFDYDDREGRADQALERRMHQVREVLRRHFSPDRGFSEPVEIDYLDGMRVTFAGADVAHVRPSGNAPQLRIYAVADSEARAEQIVQLGLSEPGGILRSMAAEVEGVAG